MMMRFGGGGIDGTDFSPRSVSLGKAQTNRIPYINTSGGLPTPFLPGTHTRPRPINFEGGPLTLGGDMPPGAPGTGTLPVRMSGGPAHLRLAPEDAGSPPNVLGAEAVRATGTGPYDSAYRQNLATYAGGQFVRPGGNLSFNPTGGLFGNPTGGGNAAVLGMPNSLISQALSSNPFKFTPPPPPPPPPPDDDGQWRNPLGWWHDQFLDNGRLLGGGMRMMEME